ncbi:MULTISPECIES: hypothetical protein [Pseudomonas]|jgi:hypothetical protein|uniref:hypothetical protein n=1 Tax=Pseudomonas TaxID=286 RepID=UPI0018E8759D|nr:MULTISPECIES: hypothetical protein [Pseudomonas]MBJ2214087.1 hypothetical protein [Pseudomonas carnis]MBP5947956.1 hypothetical protein [Pseudomonas sp. P9(2020)]
MTNSRPSAQPITAGEPNFFVAAASHNYPFLTSDTVPESLLTNAGYVVDRKSVHGDFGLYLNGNLFGHLFLSKEALDQYASAFAPGIKATPGSMMGWWKV